MRFLPFPLVVGATLIPHVYAWGVVGHEVVATVAEMHLHPSVMPKLCDILDVDLQDCHLAPVAAWADQVRRQAKYRWTAPLHYIGAVDDYPSATCAFPGAHGWEGRTHINVLNAIRNTTTVLQDFAQHLTAEGTTPNTDTDTDTDVPPYVQDALKFLIHFVGDMHMPLHLTGRDRGGNGDKVSFDGRTTNLHTVWDSLLISERLRTLPRNYTHPLPLPEIESYLRGTIYDPYLRRLVWEGLLGRYKDELESWLECPAPSASASVRPASTWDTVLSVLSSVFGRDVGMGMDVNVNVVESQDGLGVDDDTLCPYAWAKPVHELNCAIVFPKQLDEHDVRHKKKPSPYLELYTPEYAGVIKSEWIVERLLTQAGVRLAAVLNWIFADVREERVFLPVGSSR